MIKKSWLPRKQTELTTQKAVRTVVTCQGTRKAPIGSWLTMSNSTWSCKRGGMSGGRQPWCWTISVFGCFSLLLSYRSWLYFFRLRCKKEKKSNAFTRKLPSNVLNSNWLSSINTLQMNRAWQKILVDIKEKVIKASKFRFVSKCNSCFQANQAYIKSYHLWYLEIFSYETAQLR